VSFNSAISFKEDLDVQIEARKLKKMYKSACKGLMKESVQDGKIEENETKMVAGTKV